MLHDFESRLCLSMQLVLGAGINPFVCRDNSRMEKTCFASFQKISLKSSYRCVVRNLLC